MKTEMKIKTDGRSLFGCKKAWKNDENGKNKPIVCKAWTRCAALLSVLCVGAFAGALGGQGAMVTAPVSVSYHAAKDQDGGAQEIRSRHESDRREELTLLEDIINHPQAQQETIKSALEQKLLLTKRMEMEAQVNAALRHLGVEEAAALCGAGQMSVILSQSEGLEQERMVKIIDTAAAVTGYEPKDIRIILSKK